MLKFNCLCPSRKICLKPAFLLLLAATVFTGLMCAAANENRPEDVIAFLNQAVTWHRQLNAQQELVNEANDEVFLNDNRQLAEQVLRLSFEYARVQAQLLGNPGNAQGQVVNPQYQNLADLLAKSNQRVLGLQHELDSFKKQLESASTRKRKVVESQISETQGEIELAQARRDTVRTMLDFANSASSNGTGSGGLRAQIEELARTIPALSADPKSQPINSNSSATTLNSKGERKDEPSGILALMTEIVELKHKLRVLDESLKATDSLSESARKLRTPVLAEIRKFAQRGDELAQQPESQDPATLAQERKEVDGLTAQFKQLSAALLPLSKETILLDVYKRNAQSWRTDVAGHYSTHMKSLFMRLALLGLILACILGTAEVWRRATFRYVHDVRRRHQFLLLRRIIVWPLVIVITVVALANGLGSVTTFAGLLTTVITIKIGRAHV